MSSSSWLILILFLVVVCSFSISFIRRKHKMDKFYEDWEKYEYVRCSKLFGFVEKNIVVKILSISKDNIVTYRINSNGLTFKLDTNSFYDFHLKLN